MLKWLLAALLVALTAPAALAQTTTFVTGATCPPGGISISGGTDLTFTSSGGQNCLASTGKADGAWYFTAVESSPGWSNAVGVASSSLADGALGNTVDGIAYWLFSGGSARGYAAGGLTPTPSPTITYTPGATMGFAINIIGAFQYFWVTPDINGTSGCGGGPMWNGSATSSPVVRGGCGGTSTGLQFTMGDNPVYPAIAGQNYNFSQTVASFNFGDNATMDSLLGGGGFQAWNVVGGGTVNRPSVTSNTANAPLWQQSHAYVAGDRVIAGPGMVGGALTSGSPVYLWAVSGSGGTSSGSGNGPQSCPSPANYGSGFNGISAPTQWSSHTSVNDNGITWVCLSAIDYVTIRDAVYDSPLWQGPGHTYQSSEWVTANGHAFINNTTAQTCVSGGTTPVPGGSSDGGCTWGDQGGISYSSRSNYILHVTGIYNNSVETIHVLNTPTYRLWYGGHSKQTYASGTAGEDEPIFFGFVASEGAPSNEITPFCADGITNTQVAGCGFYPWVNITTAPGDSAGETLGITGGPLRLDSANGVTLTDNTSGGAAISFNGYQHDIYGLQLYNPAGTAFGGCADAPGTPGELWGGTSSNLIVKGAGPAAHAVCSGNVNNSLIIYTGTYAYGSAIAGRFPGNLNNDILIGPGTSACSTCIGKQIEKPWYPTNDGTPYGDAVLSNYQNTWLSGFADPVFYLTTPAGSLTPEFGYSTGTNNATDTPSGYTSKLFPIPPFDRSNSPYLNAYDGGATFQWPGTSGSGCSGGPCQGLDPAAQFVHPTIDGSEDFRLKSTSVLQGAGAGPLVYPPLSYTSDVPTVDLTGQARPTSGRYDIGPVQYNGTLAAPTITSPTSATGYVGTAFVYNIGATGAPTSYGASSLPSWATLNSGTGAITGTPDAAATTNATINATNGSGTGSGPLAIIISPALVAPSITSSLSLGCAVSVFCTYQITATQSPTSFGASGLPSGLNIDTGTGVISGIPTGAGVTSGSISATNTAGTGSATLTITVSGTVAAVPGGGFRLFH